MIAEPRKGGTEPGLSAGFPLHFDRLRMARSRPSSVSGNMRSLPMTSRIIQLTVLDVLATGMTLRRGVDFQPHLRKIKESLNASRYPVGDEFN